ncbi:unnamed protein product [Rotaria socialis]|uniref:MULE transposase domain-containing protein n=1 Tax=Rotaria socialis TaxID=392032 RepID=A0A818EPF9_9BILA|nr:unnamed protein product [Rotaria socialis]CAF4589766.1 unnamed protein product [Rotaria socialis]
MVITRRQASASVASTVDSKTPDKINDQSKSTTRHRPFTRTSKRLSSPSPSNFIHRSCPQLSKKCVNNDNVKLFSTTSTRDSSSDSSSTSSRSSSSDTSSTNVSRSSSSDSSSSSRTVQMSTSNLDSSKFTAISLITESIDKMQINITKNNSSSNDIASMQQGNVLHENYLISVYKSSRNGHFLCLHGSTYQIDRSMDEKIKWKCKQSRNEIRCRAKIYTTKNLGTDEIPANQYLESNSIQHSHDIDQDQQKVASFISKLKDIGRSRRTVPPSKIVNELATSMKLSDNQLGMIPSYASIYQKVYRSRSKTMPPLPKSINFEIPTAFSVASSGETFVFFDHLYDKGTKRILAFSSSMQLKHLFSSKLICVDGTFSIVPKLYKQLVIIQTIDRQKYHATPVVYALLNDKKTRTYKLLFDALKRKAEEIEMTFEPERIISDFEGGMISTVKKQLPNTTHQGCLFHLYQGLTKQMKKLGLWSSYKDHNDLHLFIKKVMAIVLLKPKVMDHAYQLLLNQYLKQRRLKQFIVQLTKFMFYFQKQWMASSMRSMITFYDVDFKTNNWSESYNSALQRRAQQNHLSIWALIELLIIEETAVRIKHFQLLNGKTRRVNKAVRDDVLEINKKIIECNQKFEDDEIQLDECLLSLASLVGVKYDKWRKLRKKNRKRKDDNADN